MTGKAAVPPARVVLERLGDGRRMELIEDVRLRLGVLSWSSQVCQYPLFGPPGLGYYAGDVTRFYGPGTPPVDCLLYRGPNGRVIGIANHFPVDYWPLERAGNVLILVDPARRRHGLGLTLADALDERYGLDPTAQRLSVAGLRLAVAWLRTRGWNELRA